MTGRTVAVVLLTSALLPTPRAATAPGDRSASLTLEVRHGVKPLEGAVVEIEPIVDGKAQGETLRRTIEDGPLVVAGLTAGRYRVRVKAEGYAERELLSVIVPAAAEPRLEIDLLRSYSLDGKVSDAAGKAVEGAEVCLLREARPGAPPEEREDGALEAGRACVKSDAEGRATLANVPEGSYKLSIEKKGLVPLLKPLDLSKKLPPQTWRLTAGGTLTGRVLDLEDKPVPKARIVVSDRLRERSKDGTVDTLTDPEGRFKLSGLAPGAYRVQVEPPDATGPFLDGIDVKEGAATDLGTLRTRPGLSLTGVVLDPDDKPLKDVDVRAHQRSDSHRLLRRATTDEEGRFRLGGLQETAVDLVVKPPKGFAPRRVEEVALPRADLRIDLEEAGRISGRVKVASGTLPPRVTVRATSPSDRKLAGGDSDWATTDEIDPDSGRFLLEGVLPADGVTVDARAAGFWSEPVKLTVEAGQEAGPVDLVLEKGLAVEGRVADTRSLPIPDAQVASAAGQTALTDALGAFRLEGLRPGMQQLTASHPDHAPDARRVAVPLPEGEKLLFELGSGGTIEGSVLDVDDTPVEGVPISMKDPAKRTTTDARGRYRLDHVPSGERTVTRGSYPATEGGYEDRSAKVTEGETVTLDFKLGATLQGLVTRAGAPVPGAAINFAQPQDWKRLSTNEHLSLSSFTDADGRYRLSGVRQGRSCLTVLDSGQRVTRQVEIPSGREPKVDLALPDRPVHGVVVAAKDGRPLPDSEVQAQLPSPFASQSGSTTWSSTTNDLGESTTEVITTRDGASTRTDGEGRFTLFLEGPDRQNLHAFQFGYEGTTTEVDLASPSPVTLKLSRTAKLVVLLRDPDGRPVGTDCEVCVTWEDSSNCNATGSPRVEMSVREGTYDLTASAAGFGTKVLEGREATVDPEGRPEEVVLTLVPGAALLLRLPGTEAVEPRLVSLKDPTGAERKALVEARGFDDGEYGWTTKTLEPGDWEVVVDPGDGKEIRRTVTVRPGPVMEVVLP